jgi:vacuolar-type H+-ATPase subunit C/Vma6
MINNTKILRKIVITTLSLLTAGCATQSNINTAPIGSKLDKAYYEECEDTSVSLKNSEEAEILQLIRTLRGDLKKCAKRQKASVEVIKRLTEAK